MKNKLKIILALSLMLILSSCVYHVQQPFIVTKVESYNDYYRCYLNNNDCIIFETNTNYKVGDTLK